MASDTDEQSFFEAQVTGLLSALYGAAKRLVKNRADAEDLVADAVEKAWVNRRSLRNRARFRPWIFRILMNTFISDVRKRALRPSREILSEGRADDEPAFSLFERLHQPFLLWWSNPEQEFLNKLLREDIERAMDALPEAYRVAVVLCDLEGFSYAEMAEIVNVPVGTVRSRLSRGRGLLQQALWTHAEEAGLVKPATTRREVSVTR